MNTKTKIELFASEKNECCANEPETKSSCCDDSDNSCSCEGCDIVVYPTNSDSAKSRAQELKITAFPAIAINGQVVRCDAISKAIERTIGSSCCCCC